MQLLDSFIVYHLEYTLYEYLDMKDFISRNSIHLGRLDGKWIFCNCATLQILWIHKKLFYIREWLILARISHSQTCRWRNMNKEVYISNMVWDNYYISGSTGGLMICGKKLSCDKNTWAHNLRQPLQLQKHHSLNKSDKNIEVGSHCSISQKIHRGVTTIMIKE